MRGIPWRNKKPSMSGRDQLTKAQKIALAERQVESIKRRRGVDKSKIPDESQDVEVVEQTQEIINDWTDQRNIMDEDFAAEDEDEGFAQTEEEFNDVAEELFLEKLDRWFADYAPKLFDLGLAKHLSKLEKKKDKGESSGTSRRPSKKSK